MTAPKSPKRYNFWPPHGARMAIAHRGGDGAGFNKENTILAFKTAWDMGYKYGETDAVLTSDGKIIAIHGSRNRLDSLLKKHRTPRSVLQNMTADEVRQQIKIGGERVPLLEELLKSQPRMKFFIDAKTDEVIEPLAALLKKLNVLDRVCVGTFDYQRLQRLLDLLEPYKPASCINIGRSAKLKNKNLQMLKAGHLARVDAVHLHHSLVSKSMINLLHSHNTKVLIWTCNSRLSIRHAIKSGADGIISDRVELLQQTLGR
ncbi:MAG TPA: glycerophosphodiester phosphodiesterase family protein [Candidatus Binatia bacterium]|nr:glycerophosphodiester phosphodiesterase family protein [Candidatus Binatia bacterium]